jgi:hypothetical protein
VRNKINKKIIIIRNLHYLLELVDGPKHLQAQLCGLPIPPVDKMKKKQNNNNFMNEEIKKKKKIKQILNNNKYIKILIL